MLRTVEALFVVVIVLSTLFGVIHYIDLPSPRMTSSIGLKDMAESMLSSLDEDAFLTQTVFNGDDNAWAKLQNSLDSSLSANVMYNMKVYDVDTTHEGEVKYNLVKSLFNFEGNLPSESDTAFIIATSPNVTFTVTPEKIGARYGKELTLYILNCEDANGWWVTGYTAKSFARDIYNMISPYFKTTIFVNSTAQLKNILNNQTITSISTERIKDAVIMNTFGEAVPIPSEMANSSFYQKYPWYLGQKVNAYNWTWVSIVGYPLYYVTNTEAFKNDDNTWGIFGMKNVGPSGLNGFLQGLNGSDYTYDGGWITQSINVVHLTNMAKEMTNYFGIYPQTYQTATRAVPNDTLALYTVYLNPSSNVFDPQPVSQSRSYFAGATFSHRKNNSIHGSLTVIGLARTPDIRVSVFSLLMFYRPNIYRSEFGAEGTSRLIILQLGQVGDD